MLTAPFPYFGGKRNAVSLVWHAFGIECRNYVEPFFGSGAMLLGAPKQLPKLGTGDGIHSTGGDGDRIGFVTRWMCKLHERLIDVRVTCGDWTRVLGKVPTTENYLTAVFLDPPYERGDFQYGDGTDRSVAHDVRAWCAANGDNDLLRIALCGHDGDHDELLALGWDKRYWKAQNGYARKSELWKGESIWFSPHCNKPHGLF